MVRIQRNQKNNIHAMKATTKTNRIAQATLIAIALVLVSFTQPAQAGSGSKNSGKVETSAAAARLESYSLGFEKSITYNAPSVAEDAASLEMEEALRRLDEIAAVQEAGAAYVAPCVCDDTDLQTAYENMDDLSGRIESFLAYNAPAITE
jgi:hypothetical protein